jgi:hypothetical protein
VNVFVAGVVTDKLSSALLGWYYAVMHSVAGVGLLTLARDPATLGLRSVAAALVAMSCVVPSIYIPGPKVVMELGGAYAGTLSSVIDAPSQLASVFLLARAYPVRAALERLSALSVFLCRSVFYGAFVWARRALNSQKRRFPARAVGHGARRLADGVEGPHGRVRRRWGVCGAAASAERLQQDQCVAACGLQASCCC